MASLVGREAQSTGDDIVGDVGHEPAGAEGVAAQAQQRFGHRDVELRGDHPRGLVHDEPEVATHLQAGANAPGAARRPACR